MEILASSNDEERWTFARFNCECSMCLLDVFIDKLEPPTLTFMSIWDGRGVGVWKRIKGAMALLFGRDSCNNDVILRPDDVSQLIHILERYQSYKVENRN